MRSIGMRYESWPTSEPRGSPTRESEVDASETAACIIYERSLPKAKVLIAVGKGDLKN